LKFAATLMVAFCGARDQTGIFTTWAVSLVGIEVDCQRDDMTAFDGQVAFLQLLKNVTSPSHGVSLLSQLCALIVKSISPPRSSSAYCCNEGVESCCVQSRKVA
jgi:hypothetical protein